MIQGWHDDDYLILFENESDALEAGQQYGIPHRLPGYSLIGLRSWDDFLIIDSDGVVWTVPTVPALPEDLEKFDSEIDLSKLTPDENFTDRIKWYTKPLVFGGDPESEENTAWLSLDQHIDAVRWWNQKYDEVATQQ